jgi:acetyl esterase/lipase
MPNPVARRSRRTVATRLLAAPARALAWASLVVATGLLVRAEVLRPELPAGVRATTEIVYRVADGRRLRLDVYRPVGPAPPGGFPALVAVHGGGWRGGSRTGYGRDLAAGLVPHGLAVVAVDYRLSRPGLPAWPGNADDVRHAVRWVREHAAAFGIDPARIALIGASAGAHLALVAALDPNPAGRDQVTGVESPRKHAGATRPVRALIDFYGPTDLRALRAARAAAGVPVDLLLGGSPAEVPERYEAASPARLVSPAAPPTLIVHGTDDALVPLDQSRALAEALGRAGVPHRLVVVDGARHGFGLQVRDRTPEIDLTLQILAFLASVWNDEIQTPHSP